MIAEPVDPGGTTAPRASLSGPLRASAAGPLDGSLGGVRDIPGAPRIPRSGAEGNARRMARFGFVVTLGYLLFGRSWSYLGLAPANLYIGELTLAAVIIFRPTRAILGGLLHQFHRPGRFHVLSVAMVLFLGYGVLETVRGLMDGGDPVALLKSLPLYYYPALLALGMWLARRDPFVLPTLAWALAWGNATYGLANAAVLNSSTATLPGQPEVPLFDLGITCSAVAILGLVAFPRRSRWTIPLVLANTAVLFGHQIRAEWVSLLVALAVWCVLARQVRRLMLGLAAVVLLLVAVTAANVTIPGPDDRGGNVKVGDIIGRALGPVSPELAARYTSESRAEGAAGTADFRQEWWKGIWRSSTSNPTTLAFGHGYGFNLQSLAPPGKVDLTVRSPHNLFFYTLGYTGLLGVGLLVLLLGTLGRLLWSAFRVTGDPTGLAILILMVTSAQFEPWLESPFGAAVTYLLIGMCLAPLAGSESRLRMPARRLPVRGPRRVGNWGPVPDTSGRLGGPGGLRRPAGLAPAR